VCVCLYVCLCLFMCVCVSMFVLCVCVYVYVYVCMCVYVYVFIASKHIVFSLYSQSSIGCSCDLVVDVVALSDMTLCSSLLYCVPPPQTHTPMPMPHRMRDLLRRQWAITCSRVLSTNMLSALQVVRRPILHSLPPPPPLLLRPPPPRLQVLGTLMKSLGLPVISS
jgi:hypothetical protein